MPADNRYPTPYADVNAIIDAVHSGAREVLGDYFAGMYLYGSLASSGFNPQTSDVDFVVATTDDLPTDKIAALKAMHLAMTEERFTWAMKIEGSYIPQEKLRRYDPADGPYPSLGVEMHFHMTQHLSDWVLQRHILREQGVTLAGPPIHTLIDPVPAESIRRAAAGILREWWQPLLTDPTKIQSPEYQAYAVLTMCRSLYTLEFADIVPKTQAAKWALSAIEPRWRPLIQQAVDWHPGKPLDALDNVLALIRCTLEKSAP